MISFILSFYLAGVEGQPSESERYGDLESGPATYGVVKRKRDNDMDLHSNKQVCFLSFVVWIERCSEREGIGPFVL